MTQAELSMHIARICQLAIHESIGGSFHIEASREFKPCNYLQAYSNWQLEFRAYQLQWGTEQAVIDAAYNRVADALKQLGFF